MGDGRIKGERTGLYVVPDWSRGMYIPWRIFVNDVMVDRVLRNS